MPPQRFPLCAGRPSRLGTQPRESSGGDRTCGVQLQERGRRDAVHEELSRDGSLASAPTGFVISSGYRTVQMTRGRWGRAGRSGSDRSPGHDTRLPLATARSLGAILYSCRFSSIICVDGDHRTRPCLDASSAAILPDARSNATPAARPPSRHLGPTRSPRPQTRPRMGQPAPPAATWEGLSDKSFAKMWNAIVSDDTDFTLIARSKWKSQQSGCQPVAAAGSGNAWPIRRIPSARSAILHA